MLHWNVSFVHHDVVHILPLVRSDCGLKDLELFG